MWKCIGFNWVWMMLMQTGDKAKGATQGFMDAVKSPFGGEQNKWWRLWCGAMLCYDFMLRRQIVIILPFLWIITIWCIWGSHFLCIPELHVWYGNLFMVFAVCCLLLFCIRNNFIVYEVLNWMYQVLWFFLIQGLMYHSFPFYCFIWWVIHDLCGYHCLMSRHLSF